MKPPAFLGLLVEQGLLQLVYIYIYIINYFHTYIYIYIYIIYIEYTFLLGGGGGGGGGSVALGVFCYFIYLFGRRGALGGSEGRILCAKHLLVPFCGM